jgi:DNA-binding response OmpR family regulator
MFEKWRTRRLHSDPNGNGPPAVLALIASPGDANLLRDIFAKTEWEFRIADDLEEGIAFLSRRAPAVILYDRDLPGGDWRQAIQRLANARCRVILASFVADDYLWDEVIHCGGYDVVAKPFREHELVHTVRFAWAALTKSLPSAPRTK